MAVANGLPHLSFSQVKGSPEEEVHDEDIVSCMSFDHRGELLATGDKSGRVVIFHRDPSSASACCDEYSLYSTFQSHTARFDSLKSLDIEAKINKIRWLKRRNACYFLLSTNDKTIKLWKISERDKVEVGFNISPENGICSKKYTPVSLRVPQWMPTRLTVNACPRRKFCNAHFYHINSISVNSDDETFLSADDLRINLWNLEVNAKSFNIVDIKPDNMEELSEVITAAEFHPTHCNEFVYSSSRGTIRFCDMRQSALCDNWSKLFEGPEDPSRSFFSEIITSISDVKFSNSGRYMLSRDYLTINVWDLHMEKRPVETYHVHDYLRNNLCLLYEKDYIFDKFECCWSGDDANIMTGSYNNFFSIFNRDTKRDVTFEACMDATKSRELLKPRKVVSQTRRKKDEVAVESLNYKKKILHTAWHPHDNIIAVAATNLLYIFHENAA